MVKVKIKWLGPSNSIVKQGEICSGILRTYEKPKERWGGNATGEVRIYTPAGRAIGQYYYPAPRVYIILSEVELTGMEKELDDLSQMGYRHG